MIKINDKIVSKYFIVNCLNESIEVVAFSILFEILISIKNSALL